MRPAREVTVSILVGLMLSCTARPRPIQYPPPAPPSGPPPSVPAATPTQPTPAPAAAEAGTVALGAAMLVGGNAMSDPALDQSTSDFKAVFAENVPVFRRCYAAAAARLPGLRGEIKVKVVIDAGGAVYDLQLLGGSITDNELVSCTTQALRTLRYRTHPGQLFAVETPIEYSP